MFKVVICLLTAVLGFGAYASERNILLLKPKYEGGTVEHPQDFWPMVGLGAGLMSAAPGSRSGGVPTEVKVLGSYYFDGNPWVADLGVGFHNEFLNQRDPGTGSVQSVYSELAARYILEDRWQLGAIWNTLVDNARRYKSNNDNLASFAGAQVLKEFSWNENYIVRVGGRATTSLGLNGGSVNTVMAELEVSFGAGFQPSVTPVGAVEFDKNAGAAPAYRQETADSAKLVHALADNRALFHKVVVIGYFADPAHQNQARTRAHLVAKKLIDAGLTPDQIIEEQRGRQGWLSQRPSPSALLLEERVRVEFEGVKNDAALSGIIDSAAL